MSFVPDVVDFDTPVLYVRGLWTGVTRVESRERSMS
jgi:hypothetical protein